MTQRFKYTRNILRRTMVFPFYRRNAGQMIFLFILFFGAVGEVGGVKVDTGPWPQLHYQYQLISGIIQNRTVMLVVALAWLVYAEKCARYLLSLLCQSDSGFLYLLNNLSSRRLFWLMLRVQWQLFLPVLLYYIAILAVALHQHRAVAGLEILTFIQAICLLSAARVSYRLRHPGRRPLGIGGLPGGGRRTAYWQFLWRHLMRKQVLLALGIKLFSCGMLVVAVRTLRVSVYDLRMPERLFGIGILSHAILIHQLRSMEEQLLLFYRSMPVGVMERYWQYARFYLLLYLPEVLTLLLLTPGLLHGPDALVFFLTGYGLLLLMNSLMFTAPMAIKDLLKVVLLLFGFIYFAVMAGLLLWMALLCLLVSGIVFGCCYYRYDPASS